MNDDCTTYFESIDEKLDLGLLDVAQIQQDVDNVVRVVNEINDKLTPPEPPFPPQADIITVVVKPPITKKQIPLRRVRDHNRAGYPLWGIYYSGSGRRVCPKRGKELQVYEKIVRGDGRKNAYRLVPGQVVDGRPIPPPSTAYILVRHTE